MKQTTNYCDNCDKPMYPDDPDYEGTFVKGLGDVCAECLKIKHIYTEEE